MLRCHKLVHVIVMSEAYRYEIVITQSTYSFRKLSLIAIWEGEIRCSGGGEDPFSHVVDSIRSFLFLLFSTWNKSRLQRGSSVILTTRWFTNEIFIHYFEQCLFFQLFYSLLSFVCPFLMLCFLEMFHVVHLVAIERISISTEDKDQ